MNDTLGSTTTYPKIVQKNWGFERIIVNTPAYCGKQLFMVAGFRCSIHTHRVKSETFFLHSGRMEIHYYDNESELQALRDDDASDEKIFEVMERVVLEQGQAFQVPVGRVHCMSALTDCVLYEFSTQDFEDDSYRIIPSPA